MTLTLQRFKMDIMAVTTCSTMGEIILDTVFLISVVKNLYGNFFYRRVVVRDAVVAQGHKRASKLDSCGFDFSNEAKRSVPFHYTTRNVSRIQRKLENGSILMRTQCLNIRLPGSLCFFYYMRNTA